MSWIWETIYYSSPPQECLSRDPLHFTCKEINPAKLFQRIGTPRIGIEISDVNTRIEPRNQKDGNKKGKKKKRI
jgi:hypothetical protein